MRSCDFNSTLDSTKAWLRTRGFIDENMRIKTSLPGFKDQVGKLTVMAKQKFGVDEGDLFTVEKIEVPKLTPTPYYRTDDKRTVYKAVPNQRAFDAIDTYKSGKSFMKVDYGLKVAEIISDNIDRIEKLFKSIGNNDTFWNKIQKDFQIPKAQILLFKDTAGANIQEKLASFLADYTYTVEINTAKESYLGNEWQIEQVDEGYDAVNKYTKERKFFIELDDAYTFIGDNKVLNKPTQHYSNLTVPGGTNYTENEIATPDIIPSIKGHAQFATDKGIGWFRSDDKLVQTKQEMDEDSKRQLAARNRLRALEGQEPLTELPSSKYITTTGSNTKTRRILEVQSDLFQKGREYKFLSDELKDFEYEGKQYHVRGAAIFVDNPQTNTSKLISREEYDKIKEKANLNSGNNFLQLLNKDNNWVTFFIKSIIQDSSKKGYEKVLFPTGNTASKVEGHETIEEFKKQKEDRIKELEKAKQKRFDEIPYVNDELINTTQKLIDKNIGNREENIKKLAKYKKQKEVGVDVSDLDNEINQLKQELERVEREGFGALKPIYNFYENVVGNILKKQGYSPVLITDEHGNSWYEIDIESSRDSARILALRASDLSMTDLRGGVRKILDSIESTMQKAGLERGKSYTLKQAIVGMSKVSDNSIFSSKVAGVLAPYLDKMGTTVSFEKSSEESGLLGFYDNESNTITLYTSAIGLWFLDNKVKLIDQDPSGKEGDSYEVLENFLSSVLVHEIVHAFTSLRIRQYNITNVPLDAAIYRRASGGKEAVPLSKAEEAAISKIKDVFSIVRDHSSLVGEYGITNVDEFVAEAMSNEVFANKLKQIPLPPTVTAGMGGLDIVSFLKKIINYLISVFSPTQPVDPKISAFAQAEAFTELMLSTYNKEFEDIYVKDVRIFYSSLRGEPQERLALKRLNEFAKLDDRSKVGEINKEYRDLAQLAPYESFLSNKPSNSPDVKSVISRMQAMFPGMKVVYVKEGDANYIKGANAHVKGNTVYVQEDVDGLVMIEEFLHPFVNAMFTGNKSLFNSLYVQTMSQMPEIAEEVNRLYRESKGFTEQDRQQEIVARGLAVALNSEFSTKPAKKVPSKYRNVANRFLDWLYRTLNKLFGNKFKPFGVYPEFLPSSITLKELASILNEGTSYITNFSEDRRFNLKQDQLDILADVSTLLTDNTKLSNVVEDFFNMAENQIFRLRQNKNYDKLREVLSNADGTSRYVDLKMLLKDAKDKTDSVEDMRFKMRQVVNSLLFIEELGDKMVKLAEELDKDQTIDIREKVSRLRYYMQLANNWEQFLDQFGKGLTSRNTALNATIAKSRANFRALENLVLMSDKSGVVEVLDEALGNVRKTIDDLYQKETEKLKDMIAKGKNVTANKKLLANREAEWAKFNLSKDNLIKFINGEYGDTNMFSALFEAYISSPDPVVGGFAKFIKTNFYDVELHLQRVKTKMLNELDPLMQGVDRSNPKELGEKITFKDTIASYDEAGNMVSEKTLTFLSEFKDYRYEMSRLEHALSMAKQEGNEDKIAEAKAEYDRVRIAFMHNEYVPEYYARQEIFNTPIGKIAKAKRDEILSDVKHKQFEINNKAEPTEEDVRELNELWRKYRALHSKFDMITGEEKTGVDLEVATLLQEYKVNSRKFYEWTEMKGAYERARTSFIEELMAKGLAEGSEEYNNALQTWEDSNTRTIVDETFYTEVRQPLLDVLDTLSRKLPGGDEKKNRISEAWDELFQQTSSFRDEDNQLDASAMTEGKIRKSKEIEQRIKDIRDQYVRLSGLTKEQANRRSELYDKATLYGYLSPQEEAELEMLNNLSTIRGLTKAEKRLFLDTIAKLDAIQTRVASDYYVDALNEKLREYGHEVESGNALKFINSLEFHTILANNKDFSKWFDANHFEEERTDAEGETYIEYRPLYIWTRTVPVDPRYFTKVPGYKYMKREVKKEYRTEKKVGETVDNRGQWLPRKDVPGSPFINQDYYNLKKNDPTAFKILEIVKKYSLEEQQGLGRQHRLYLDVPRVRKSRLEGVREGDIKEKATWAWNQLKQKIQPQKDDFSEDYGNYSPEASATTKIVSTDMFSNELIMAPIRYTAKIPLEVQTYDVIGATLKYMQSAAMNKRLVEINPIAQAFKEVLTSEGVKDTKKISRYHLFRNKQKVYANKSIDKYNRLKAISNLIEREFEGVESKMEMGEVANKAAETLMRVSALTSLALDVPGAFKNLFSAHMQNVIQSIGKDFITTSDWWRGNGIFMNTYMKNLIADNYKLGNKSIYTQMFQLFDPIQGNFMDHFGRETSASKLQDFVAGKWAFAPRQFGELEAQGSLFLGVMSRMTVEQTLPDGTVKKLRYLDAFELDKDGVIQLKAGVDPEWGPNGTKFKEFKLKLHEINQRLQGNYARVDRTELERYTSGRLAIFLRKYLVPAFVNRYAPTRINVGVGGLTQGYYRSFVDISLNFFKNGMKSNWNAYTESERRNFLKTASEIGISLALASIMLIMGFDEDDPDKFKKLEDNSWLYNHILYQVMMIKSEEEQFIPWLGMGVNELQRIKNTPSIAFGQMDRYVVLLNDLASDVLQPFTDEDITHFQRKTGFWEQGDRKDFAHLLRIFGFTGATMDSEAAVRNYYLMSTRTK